MRPSIARLSWLVSCCLLACLPALAAPLAAQAPTTSAPAASASAPQAGQADTGAVPIPEPSARAVRYYRTGNVLWAVSTLWGFAVPVLFLFTGFSARMRNWSLKIGRYWYLALLAYFALYLVVSYLLDWPLDYYASFVRPHAYGLSSQAFSKWLTDGLKSLGIGFVFGALFLWVPYLLLRRATKRWWFYTWLASLPVVVLLLFVQPIWIAPLFNHFGPMKDKALESQILQLAHRAGIDDARVFEVNKSVDTNQLNAYVAGIGHTQRIVLWDTILRTLTPRQILVVMGHEMGHYVLGHTWRLIGMLALVLFVGLWGIHKTAGWTLRTFGERFRFHELGDFASLPLIILLFGIFSFLITPILLGYSRHVEHEADRFGLEITHDNHACGEAFVKLAKHDLGYPRPGWLYKVWRAGHPPLGERIDFCNDYHPWTEGEPQRYGDRFTPAPAPGG